MKHTKSTSPFSSNFHVFYFNKVISSHWFEITLKTDGVETVYRHSEFLYKICILYVEWIFVNKR